MIQQATAISSCYLGPSISPEQFVQEHFFLYLKEGKIEGFDGHQHYTLKAGQYCLVRKNHLVRYHKEYDNNRFGKVVVIFDEAFLRAYQEKYSPVVNTTAGGGTFLRLPKTPLVPAFVQSLAPYYLGEGKMDEHFSNVKREELLLILLQADPSLAGALFDFGMPAKIDLEAFMQQHYKFNVSMERFAYLTGRSLSAFKRDFKKIFNETPNKWLVQRRLREGYFLLDKKGEKPSDIYLDLGFEDLSHFSYAFKNHSALPPSVYCASRPPPKSMLRCTRTSSRK